MPTTTLFPLERQPLKPDPQLREPVIWLKRLVLLSSLNSKSMIREIEFRRGLNIIRTEQMKTQGGPVAGHSVGKTLLMRLIRYLLGETHFGPDDTQDRIAAVAPSAYVVGQWSVAGVDWIVVRPMKVKDAPESFAAISQDWQTVVDSPQRESSHRDFVQAVSNATLADLPTFKLPRGREARWLDVLAWLSRDYQCGYRKANEWRHEDANSGPSLDLKENNLIMQWVMGLMSPDEIDLRLAHHELLEKQGEQLKRQKRTQRKLKTLWPSLRSRLELAEDVEIADDQATFHAVKPRKVVEGRIESLMRLREERIAKARVAELEDARETAQDSVNDAEATIRTCRNEIKRLEGEIREYEADPLQYYARCQAQPCWMKEQAKKIAADPAAESHLTDLRGDVAEQQRQLAGAERDKGEALASLQRANQRLRAERQRLAGELSGIDENIGRWKGFQGDADTFQTLSNAAARSARAVAKAESDVTSSLKLQEDVRSKHQASVARLSDVYDELLQRTFGQEGLGEIHVDGNGLQPAPDRKLAPAGAALSVMTSVLAFDLACLAASVRGIGCHPRFLMHDSPREGDMEAPLFRRLFELVHELELEFGDSPHLSFQYIVTTTTAPPDALADDDGPYVRETLDASPDDDSGRLLKRRF